MPRSAHKTQTSSAPPPELEEEEFSVTSVDALDDRPLAAETQVIVNVSDIDDADRA
jgi:hypothetical protein